MEAITLKKNIFENYAGVELEDMEEANGGPDSSPQQSDFDRAKHDIEAAANQDPPKAARDPHSARDPQRPTPNLTPPLTPQPSAHENDLLSSRRLPLNGPASSNPRRSPFLQADADRPASPQTQPNPNPGTQLPDANRERLGRPDSPDSQVTSQSTIAMMVREERKSDAHSYLVYMATYSAQLCFAVLVLAVASLAGFQKFSSVLLSFGTTLLADIALKVALTVKYQKESNPSKKTKLKSWVEIISGVKDLVLLLFIVGSGDQVLKLIQATKQQASIDEATVLGSSMTLLVYFVMVMYFMISSGLCLRYTVAALHPVRHAQPPSHLFPNFHAGQA